MHKLAIGQLSNTPRVSVVLLLHPLVGLCTFCMVNSCNLCDYVTSLGLHPSLLQDNDSELIDCGEMESET